MNSRKKSIIEATLLGCLYFAFAAMGCIAQEQASQQEQVIPGLGKPLVRPVRLEEV